MFSIHRGTEDEWPNRGCRTWPFSPMFKSRHGGRLLAVALALLSAQANWLQASPVPDLTLITLDGKARLLSEYHGKIVVLNFWATWCLPCRHEMPMLSKLASKYGTNDVLFLAASIDDAETRPKIARFLLKRKISLEVFTGPTPGDLKQLQLGEIIPATLIFDRNGTPVFRIEGEASQKDISSRVDWLVSQRMNKRPKTLIKRY